MNRNGYTKAGGQSSDEEREKQFIPSRLDLKTKFCLMTAIIYGTQEPDARTIDEIVDVCVDIENAVHDRVIKMKEDNPIRPSRLGGRR